MRRFFISLALMFALQVQATTLLYKSFDDLVKEADGIVIGTVTNIEAYRDGQGEIYTYVTLGDLEMLYGRYDRKQLTLRLKGGQVGDEILQVVGSPTFQQNERLILFVQGNGSQIVPLVGWGQGLFRAQVDSASGQEVISDSDGNRVFSVQSGHVVKEQRFASQAEIVGSHSPLYPNYVVYSRPPEFGFGQAENGELAQALDLRIADKGQSPIRLQNFVAEIQKRAKQRQRALAPMVSVAVGDHGQTQKGVDARPSGVKESIMNQQAPTMDSGNVVLPKRASEGDQKPEQR